MVLESFFIDKSFYNLELLIKSVNEFTGLKSYAVVKNKVNFLKKKIFARSD